MSAEKGHSYEPAPEPPVGYSVASPEGNSHAYQQTPVIGYPQPSYHLAPVVYQALPQQDIWMPPQPFVGEKTYAIYVLSLHSSTALHPIIEHVTSLLVPPVHDSTVFSTGTSTVSICSCAYMQA